MCSLEKRAHVPQPCTSVLNNGGVASIEIPNHDFISCLAVVKIGLKLKRHNFLLCGWVLELPLASANNELFWNKYFFVCRGLGGFSDFQLGPGILEFGNGCSGAPLARTADNRQNSCKFSVSIQTFLPVNGWQNIPACHVYKWELLKYFDKIWRCTPLCRKCFILRFN